MTEVLRIGATVATPLGLLGLIAALCYYFYSRHLKYEEKKLEALRPEERARIADQRLNRYGIKGSNLTRDDKTRLILQEMDKRHQFAKMCTIICAVVFVICFGLASITYISAVRPDDQHTKEIHELKDKFEALRAEAQVVKMKLEGLSGRPPAPELRASVVNWHQAVDPTSEDVQTILLDSSLSDADKVNLLVMSTMKAIDRDIEHQAQLVNSIQS